MTSTTSTSPRRSAFDRLFRNRETGELAIVQVPNPPLALFLLAAALRWVFHPHGAVGTAVSVVSGLALAWWSVDEIVRGDSVFRRLLGAVVLAVVVVGVLTG